MRAAIVRKFLGYDKASASEQKSVMQWTGIKCGLQIKKASWEYQENIKGNLRKMRKGFEQEPGLNF